ncbi:MAG: hypothetical protein G01um101419_143 [Parcubacteria group bacterium Gr01-1014_19]|nr:MAG: hypothetical protein G01um101419_143 [Parcubacteria group bacterium Gr01-1014_19]
MCEFVSWKEVEAKGSKKTVFFLTDDEVFSERGREMLEGLKDNDFLGHHAIDNIWGSLCKGGKHGEEKNFWESDKLPKEIQAKLHDFESFKKNFGRMITQFAQEDDLEYIIQNAPSDKKWKGLKSFCRAALAAIPMRDVKTEVLEVGVRHDLSVDELVKANKLAWANEAVTSKNYPAKKGSAKKQELVLVSMGRDASTKDILKMMKVLKLKAAKPVALLSLGLDHPNRQKENPIVALGQTWRGSGGRRGVPCLCFGGARGLGLGWCGGGWDAGCRVLAVRNS